MSNKKLEWRTVLKTPNEVMPLQINPRKISEAQMTKLVESLQKFGLVSLPELDFDDTILSGHQRIKALIAMGKGDVAIEMRVPNRKLTERERKEWNLRANTHFGEFDMEVLMEDFGEFNFGELGMLDLQVNLENFVLNDLENPEKKEADNSITNKVAEGDNYVAPEVIETDIVQGDLFEFVGEKVRHRLLCGDSTKEEDVERLMNGEKTDMVFTDPPYGISIVKGGKVGGGGEVKIKGGKVGGRGIVAAGEYLQIRNDNNTNCAKDNYFLLKKLGFKNFIIWGGNYFTDFLPPSMGWIIWDKRNGDNNFSDCEIAWTSYNKKVDLISYLWNGLIREGSRDIELLKRVHPTQKPVGLIINILKDYDYNICYDFFGGSGSTMVANHKLNKSCLMIEFEPHYIQVIVDRMRKLDDTLKVYKNGVLLE